MVQLMINRVTVFGWPPVPNLVKIARNPENRRLLAIPGRELKDKNILL